MAILNKDGSVYKLKGPNPLMLKQERWDPDKLVYYNFVWESIIIPDLKKNQPRSLPEPEEVKAIEPEEVISQPQLMPLSKPVAPKSTPKPVSTIQVHCLPGNLKIYKDTLYNEIRTTISYGEKFIFEATVVERSDLKLVLWSERMISEGSIIYPQTGHARWWKVTKSNSNQITCMPSDEQPSFQ